MDATRTFPITDKPLNPGSPEAVEAGCTCPGLSNRRGFGVFPVTPGHPQFEINPLCPLHGFDDGEEPND